MLNRYPLWKNLLLLMIVALGLFYAAPNLYAPDPALQISGQSSATLIDERTLKRATDALTEGGVEFFGAEVGERAASGLIRLRQRDDQLRAQRMLKRALGDGYVVALNLAETTPAWLSDYGAQPMKYGLDLSGGVHFKLEVDIDSAVERRMETFFVGSRKLLREEGLRGILKQDDTGAMHGVFKAEQLRDDAIAAIRKTYPELVVQRTAEEWGLKATLSEAARKEIGSYALTQNLTTLRNRVNELGVSEPLVQPQGNNRIVVELPGIQDTAEAKRILGKTANLEFRLVATSDASASSREQFKFRSASRAGASEWLEREIVITGERVSNAQSSFDQNGRPNVNISLDGEGGALMHRATRNNIKRRMGVLFIERKNRTRYEINEQGEEIIIKTPYDEKSVITAPTIQSALGAQFQITGLDSVQEASELALLLRAGALAAPMDFVEERTVGPSLGAENVAQGLMSVQVGLSLVVLFMVLYYRVFGIAAIVALSANLVLLIACMSILGATLTLPGIAGIVLTVGMAVDANVLIFSRIREELVNGLSPQMAIHSGFERAVVTILDANITTLLVAVILYAVGTGPVKGFAVTLSIGIVTSMLTAIMGTRALVNLVYGGRTLNSIQIGGSRK
ncbi:protein translocase subunit SecD [Halieaceae bacterium IMCC14734]|uniref:Protein translocase subunit SecD n=1 Tax=Candidatus Litorirhabdus singularis TaxID=2518993 RepID=A0ABT3THF3_9GAMM|nr:protein translocase subunit SecD [Candidatus Litorirhabdus singularis]MCX2981758.1 protein translocase subunit SecD [Candidatus Litorirhabdus singularis]